MPVGTNGQERPDGTATSSFTVSALSRGKGVPEPTRSAWQAAWNVLESAQRDGKVLRLEQTRIGLEGEVRLCAEFRDLKLAREMLDRVRAIVKGVELLNLAEEPCSGR